MHHPTHIDGRSVVILRQGRRGFHVVESGMLSYDGQTLTLGEDESRRVFSDDELQSLMPVVEASRIPECRGFDFFVLSEADA
ncbi:MAG: hypothetical protein WKF75_19260 [Singulisphaera sp.]